jgi:hypothetical protein
VYICIVSSWWGSELEIGGVWGGVVCSGVWVSLGLCHCGGGGVLRCGVFGNRDKVQFVKLFGQVLCGGADKLRGEEN